MNTRTKSPSLKGIVCIDIKASHKSKQGNADRYDGCVVTFRTEKGRHNEVVPIEDRMQYVGTVFVEETGGV